MNFLTHPHPSLAHRARRLEQGGFTMIEIALSLAIIGFGLVAVIGVMPNLMTASRQAIDYTEVALAAQDCIEYDFSNNHTPAELDLAAPSSGLGSVLTQVTTNQSFKADTIVSYFPATNVWATNDFKDAVGGSGKPLLRTVRVEYKWPRGAAIQQRFTFLTEVAATRDIPMNP